MSYFGLSGFDKRGDVWTGVNTTFPGLAKPPYPARSQAVTVQLLQVLTMRTKETIDSVETLPLCLDTQ